MVFLSWVIIIFNSGKKTKEDAVKGSERKSARAKKRV
jgi:small subunit ribosomal protein S8e